MAEKTYNRLYFNSITFDKDNGIIQPNFLCPKCGDQKIPTSCPTAKLSTDSLDIVKDKDIDSNKLKKFVMPCCGTEISLYIAIYNDIKTGVTSQYISVNPISSDWYKKVNFQIDTKNE